ncbi:MAG: phosphoesterase, partial [Bifidobacterium sp.]|nr:phosphoesterase [Bifidobacterium sp.]
MHRSKTHCIPSHIQKEQQIMKYFTTDTHFGHPLVSVLRGFTTFD